MAWDQRAFIGKNEPVRVEASDPDWPNRFEKERKALAKVVGDLAVGGIHHVGSTSVPGLDAKPIIDILVGVADLSTSRVLIEPLAKLNYLYAPYRPNEMHWFCKPDPAHRTHHLHLVPVDSARFRDELAFRNYLRSHPDVAAEYASLKRRLGAELEHDREAYTEAKADFVDSVLVLANAESAGSTGGAAA